MTDKDHSSTPHVGHRYMPRSVASRGVFDVSRATPPSRPAQPRQDAPIVRAQPSVSASPTKNVQRAPAATKPAAPRQKRSLVLRRQIVQGATTYKEKQQQQKRRQFIAFVFGSFATAAVIAAIFTSVGLIKSKSGANVSPQTLGASVTTGSAPLSEAAPTLDEINEYKVDANKPRVMKIAKLGVTAKITPVQSNINGEPLAPRNIFDAGWFEKSGALGSSDPTVLLGNIVGPTKTGIFHNLSDLAVGDTITVEQGDGKVFTYSVVSSQSYDQDKITPNDMKQSAIAGKPGLNLLTTNGRFNIRTNQYEKRTLILAVMQ